MAPADLDFWNSRPTLRSSTSHVLLDGHLVVWPPTSGPGVIDRAGSVVAAFFTGEATVAELAEDFAASAEIGLPQARQMVGELVAKMTTADLVEGVSTVPEEIAEGTPGAPVDAPVDPVGEQAPSGGGADFADELAEALGQGDGARFVREQLPDGRTRVSTQFTLDSAANDAQARTVAEVLAGDRSIAELAPPDSCLGYKLRVGQDAEIVQVAVGSEVLSVRCDHAGVTAALRERFADGAAGDPGPIAAFVVAPLEGEGPCRVFDAIGRRRGRPRSVEEVVHVVAHLLTERSRERSAETTLLRWGALVGHGAAVLVSPELLGAPRVGAAARAAGLTMADVRPVLRPDGWLDVAAPWGDPALADPIEVAGIIMTDDGNPDHPAPRALELLLSAEQIADDERRDQHLLAATTLMANATMSLSAVPDAAATVGRAEAILIERTASI